MGWSKKAVAIIECIQWILILSLIGIIIYSHTSRDKYIQEQLEYQKEQMYVKIYDSQEIETLKKINRELYDSIKKMSNVETAIEVRYIYTHSTDTIKSIEFIHGDDSIYRYIADNDTIKQMIDVKAKDLDWVKAEFEFHDKFLIVNREEKDKNELIIEHGPNTTIEGVDAWHRIENKKKWYQNFHVGVQVGAGYGMINKQPDIYAGVGVSYTIK